MRISAFFYTLWQGIRSIFRNKWFSLASIATISACLFLFGLFYTVLMNFQHVIKTAEEGVSISVLFEKEITEEQIIAIQDQIQKRTEVSKVIYVSADEAWENFSKDFPEGFKDGFRENPLKDSAKLDVYLNDVSQQSSLVTYTSSIEGVRDINYSDITAETLSGFNVLIGYVSLGIIFILLAVSIFLISNTVTIGISVRKEEIMIMKYIGATDFFVRSPFVIEGILIGVFGSLLPLGIIFIIYERVVEYIGVRFSILSNILQFLPAETIFRDLTPITIGIGVGIGFLGSYSTVRKHLRV
jgi:cell division transport system permease protein